MNDLYQFMTCVNAKGVALLIATVVFSTAGCIEPSSSIIKRDKKGRSTIYIPEPDGTLPGWTLEDVKQRIVNADNLSPVDRLLLCHSENANEILAYLKASQPAYLDVSGSVVSAKHLEPYVSNSRLKVFIARYAVIDDLNATLDRLRTASSINTFVLDRVLLTVEQCAAIGDISSLETISLSHCGLENEAIKRVCALSRLKVLSVDSNNLTDQLMSDLIVPPSLEKLDIRGNSGISDEGLRHLVASGRLKLICVDDERIPADIDSNRNRITARFIQEMQTSNPGVKITTSPSDVDDMRSFLHD
jgi:hypothetical protein